MNEYNKWKRYKVIKPIIVIGFLLANLILVASLSGSQIVSILAIIGLYTLIITLFKEQLIENQLYNYILNGDFHIGIWSLVFNIEKLLDEKEAIESNASEEKIRAIRENMIMTSSTNLRSRKGSK